MVCDERPANVAEWLDPTGQLWWRGVVIDELRIQAALELLAQQPRPAGATKLAGGNHEWRVRTGDYRIIYEIHDQVLLVLVLAVGHRRDSYPGLP